MKTEKHVANNNKKIVCFRYDHVSKCLLAVFPFEGEKDGLCHIIPSSGEESDMELDLIITTTVAAAFEDYYPAFYEEVENKTGWKLQTLNLNDKGTFEYHREPDSSEVAFGYGATHYIEVPFMEVLDEKMKVKKVITRGGKKYYYE